MATASWTLRTKLLLMTRFSHFLTLYKLWYLHFLHFSTLKCKGRHRLQLLLCVSIYLNIICRYVKWTVPREGKYCICTFSNKTNPPQKSYIKQNETLKNVLESCFRDSTDKQTNTKLPPGICLATIFYTTHRSKKVFEMNGAHTKFTTSNTRECVVYRHSVSSLPCSSDKYNSDFKQQKHDGCRGLSQYLTKTLAKIFA